MPKLKLSKSNLQTQRSQLQLYRRLLPSLDLKRRQLAMEYERARANYDRVLREIGESDVTIGQKLPMLSNGDIDVSGLVRLKQCDIGEENLVGVRLPVLRAVEVEVAEYSKMARPEWVDELVRQLRIAVEGRVRLAVAKRRFELITKSLRIITQRVNLFERILIPQTQGNIRRIRIFLGDLEREAVVRSKLAKSRNVAAVAEDAT